MICLATLKRQHGAVAYDLCIPQGTIWDCAPQLFLNRLKFTASSFTFNKAQRQQFSFHPWDSDCYQTFEAKTHVNNKCTVPGSKKTKYVFSGL
jgi:hypothetical protein